jgi:ferredoxin-thioredoxin reductase catalytic subunit
MAIDDQGDSEALAACRRELEACAEGATFRLHPDFRIVEGIVKGLIRRKKTTGRATCPCRVAKGDETDERIVCPCVFMREEIEREGHCHCGLFVAR